MANLPENNPFNESGEYNFPDSSAEIEIISDHDCKNQTLYEIVYRDHAKGTTGKKVIEVCNCFSTTNPIVELEVS